MEKALPSIPAKRYFTIGEVSDLCGVKPYVLRYWEQEFTQLKPMKRRGNRRYYQHHEVLLIRRIRDLLYEQGFTISGARNRLTEAAGHRDAAAPVVPEELQGDALDLDEILEELESDRPAGATAGGATNGQAVEAIPQPEVATIALSLPQMRQELISIRGLLAI